VSPADVRETRASNRLLPAAPLRDDDLAVAAHEVHVWTASLRLTEDSLADCAATLAPDEAARAASFLFAKHRDRFVAGRGFLRALLGAYLHRPARQIEFAYGAHGKPQLAGVPAGTGLQFNLSHSGELALCAVTTSRAVGVDVEALRVLDDAASIARRYFSRAENEALSGLSAEKRLAAFFAGWTRKEAYLKALGDGLARPLDAFDVTLTPGEPARLLRVEGRPEEPQRWTLAALEPGPGYAAALAVEGTALELRSLFWTGRVAGGRAWGDDERCGKRDDPVGSLEHRGTELDLADRQAVSPAVSRPKSSLPGAAELK
jgi:4'-phosphopantetheinyl transferase